MVEIVYLCSLFLGMFGIGKVMGLFIICIGVVEGGCVRYLGVNIAHYCRSESEK